MHTLTRRRFISGSAQLTLSSILLGCPYVAKEIIIPAIAQLTLEEMYTFAKSTFNKVYAGGETLEQVLDNVLPFQGELLPALHKQFKTIQVENGFCTPIIAHQHGLNRFLQLSQPETYWSLISGGGENLHVFKIHHTWLNWLINEDDCSLRVNGNSIYENCGINGCPIPVTRQAFLDVNNVEQKLQLVVSNRSHDPRVLAQHNSEHDQDWVGCPAVEGRPEKCV